MFQENSCTMLGQHLRFFEQLSHWKQPTESVCSSSSASRWKKVHSICYNDFHPILRFCNFKRQYCVHNSVTGVSTVNLFNDLETLRNTDRMLSTSVLCPTTSSFIAFAIFHAIIEKQKNNSRVDKSVP